MRFLFLLFIIVPVIEITLLIQVGSAIGVWYTVGLVLLSAFIGVNMLRRQSLSTLTRAQQRMNSGELPGQEMAEGIVIAVGGALLVTPGFVTDVIGFSCLIPQTRKALVNAVSSRFTVISAQQGFGGPFAGGPFQPGPQGGPFHADPFQTPGAGSSAQGTQRPRGVDNGDVLEGEYTHKD